MAYDTRYEPESAFIMDAVLSLSQPYLAGGGEFDGATQPKLEEVERFIDLRTSEVAAELTKFGYNTTQAVGDVGNDVSRALALAVVYGVMEDIMATKPVALNEAGRNPALEAHQRRHKVAMAVIQGVTLQIMGATRDRNLSDTLVATGRSWDDQDAIAADEDEKGALFPRGFGDPSARKSPSTAEISEPG